MTKFRTIAVATSTATLLVGAAVGMQPTANAHGGSGGSGASVVTDWTAIALRTVYTEAATPIPAGSLYLGFTSLAVHDAVSRALRNDRPRSTAVAAAAVAAHDVLVEYFPTARTNLDADLAGSLDAVPDGRAKEHGITIGARAAADMIASRVDDGRDAPITFTTPPAVGIWRPTPPLHTPFAVPWLGFVDPLLLDSPTQIRPNGPDPLTSRAYARDFREAKRMGSATGSGRTPRQTETAFFFNHNAVVQLTEALADHLTRHPRGIRATARMFALFHASTADALITTWRLKHAIAYWRPVTAIHEAGADHNPGTKADPDWTSLFPAPPYPEYPSGHASITNAFTTTLRLLTGTNRTDLRVFSAVTGTTRHYTSLTRLWRDAFHARIWLGIHFRDAMVDARHVAVRSATIGNRRL